jgi:5-methylcytosine-specific restriction endonuclease McrA
MHSLNCLGCGRVLTPSLCVGRPRVWCDACRTPYGHGRPTASILCTCGRSVAVAAGSRRRFCSRLCRLADQLASQNAAYRARVRTYELTCANCSVAFTATSASGKLPRSGRGVRRFCSHQCKTRFLFREKYQATGGRRFGRVQGAARLAVFERCGWRCQLCGAPIDRRLRFPHPGSPSLDHIIPLADGGDHAPPNWQAAHLLCNIEKGNARRRRVA